MSLHLVAYSYLKNGNAVLGSTVLDLAPGVTTLAAQSELNSALAMMSEAPKAFVCRWTS